MTAALSLSSLEAVAQSCCRDARSPKPPASTATTPATRTVRTLRRLHLRGRATAESPLCNVSPMPGWRRAGAGSDSETTEHVAMAKTDTLLTAHLAGQDHNRADPSARIHGRRVPVVFRRRVPVVFHRAPVTTLARDHRRNTHIRGGIQGARRTADRTLHLYHSR